MEYFPLVYESQVSTMFSLEVHHRHLQYDKLYCITANGQPLITGGDEYSHCIGTENVVRCFICQDYSD